MSVTIENKSVVITGSSRGIGLGIARVLGKQKAKIAVTGRQLAQVERVAAQLRDEGINAHAFEVDVRRADSIKTLMQQVVEKQGGIDILCCNAGVFPTVPLATLSESDWDDVLNINAKGSFLCVQAALPYLRQAEYGRVILTSSITGPITGYPGFSHYGASKAAQLGFMRSAAIELARDGITINAVMPGNILTEGLEGMGSQYLEEMASSIPLKRIGSPEDIGNAVLFFASRDAGFITGQTLVVDGGQVLPETLQALN